MLVEFYLLLITKLSKSKYTVKLVLREISELNLKIKLFSLNLEVKFNLSEVYNY